MSDWAKVVAGMEAAGYRYVPHSSIPWVRVEEEPTLRHAGSARLLTEAEIREIEREQGRRL